MSAAGAVGLAPSAWSGLRPLRPERVIILGAGLAGLRAGLELKALGVPVTVIEARQRAGGRVHTLLDIPGRPEGGANTIGPNYGRVISTARQLGIGLHAQGRGLPMGLMLDGERIDRAQWASAPVNDLPDALRTVTPDRLASTLLRDHPLKTSSDWRLAQMSEYDQSARQFFLSNGLSEKALDWIDANNSYGNALAETSVLSLYRVVASLGRAMAMRQPAYSMAGGNSQLPLAMAAAMGEDLVLGEQVTRLRQGGAQGTARLGDVHVECASGRRFEAAAVICTLPLPALRSVVFKPGLDQAQTNAIASVGYHWVTQAHFLAHSAYWERVEAPPGWWTDGPLGRVFVSPPDQPQGPYNLTCWINGHHCQRYDSLPMDEARQLLTSDFLAMVPEARGQVELADMMSWQREPFSQGSWAIWKPGQPSQLADLLLQQHGRVCFAGEHTSFSNSGMEGAMESADRAVLETLRMLA